MSIKDPPNIKITESDTETLRQLLTKYNKSGFGSVWTNALGYADIKEFAFPLIRKVPFPPLPFTGVEVKPKRKRIKLGSVRGDRLRSLDRSIHRFRGGMNFKK